MLSKSAKQQNSSPWTFDNLRRVWYLIFNHQNRNRQRQVIPHFYSTEQCPPTCFKAIKSSTGVREEEFWPPSSTGTVPPIKVTRQIKWIIRSKAEKLSKRKNELNNLEVLIRLTNQSKPPHPTTNSKLAKYKEIQGYSKNKSC